MIIKIGTTEFARGTNRSEPCQVQGLDGSGVLNVVPLTRSEESGIYDQRNVMHALGVQVTRHVCRIMRGTLVCISQNL